MRPARGQSHREARFWRKRLSQSFFRTWSPYPVLGSDVRRSVSENPAVLRPFTSTVLWSLMRAPGRCAMEGDLGISGTYQFSRMGRNCRSSIVNPEIRSNTFYVEYVLRRDSLDLQQHTPSERAYLMLTRGCSDTDPGTVA